ncbi:hypothetical protein EDC04DRAFT_2613713 [Pisolithus marmoratus]|nr:hypothetical protein EDC04DRAFT_2613814 [Pisolithus marmoratus]KAI5992064.1 hypothetical protein EDC04DRAFT_2613713 [Pisolithus marmoratus]
MPHFLKEIRARASADTNVDEAAACDDLQPWFNEKNYSTFARLRSLQHRASAIAFSTMALPSIWWTDTEAWSSLSFKGNHIAFSDVCKIFQDEEDLVSTWENKVLKGLKLRVDYEHIVDDPSNRNGDAQWCTQSRNKLTAMLYRNTQARDTRNLMVFGKHVTLLGQYSKMSALTGQDKLIPHALDALTSDILIQDLALACPFAEIAARYALQMRRLFTSNDLSSHGQVQLAWVKFAMTINPWRHIQTAWKAKFKCAMDDIVEMDMEDDKIESMG